MPPIEGRATSIPASPEQQHNYQRQILEREIRSQLDVFAKRAGDLYTEVFPPIALSNLDFNFRGDCGLKFIMARLTKPEDSPGQWQDYWLPICFIKSRHIEAIVCPDGTVYRFDQRCEVVDIASFPLADGRRYPLLEGIFECDEKEAVRKGKLPLNKTIKLKNGTTLFLMEHQESLSPLDLERLRILKGRLQKTLDSAKELANGLKIS